MVDATIRLCGGLSTVNRCPMVRFMRKPRPAYIDRIRALKPGKQVYFKDAKMWSIKAIASRVGTEMGRQFNNRSEENGVVVYRET